MELKCSCLRKIDVLKGKVNDPYINKKYVKKFDVQLLNIHSQHVKDEGESNS